MKTNKEAFSCPAMGTLCVSFHWERCICSELQSYEVLLDTGTFSNTSSLFRKFLRKKNVHDLQK